MVAVWDAALIGGLSVDIRTLGCFPVPAALVRWA
jgi:hypothetical protein